VEVLFPHLSGLEVSRVDDAGDSVLAFASVRGVTARCPKCGEPSSRVHGRYQRLVADGAAGGRPLLIALSVRRFRCTSPACPRVTFVEQAEGLTGRYLRRTLPLRELLARFGLELAGRAGARLAAVLGIAVHSSTILRLVMALPDPVVTAAPQVTGVDDFALRKGRVYGTVVADAESGKVIDLLPDREAATLEDWLKAAPGRKSSAGTARRPTVTARPPALRWPSRSPTAGICGTAWVNTPRRPSPRTEAASPGPRRLPETGETRRPARTTPRRCRRSRTACGTCSAASEPWSRAPWSATLPSTSC
jgi:hypothetical protein